MDSLASSMSETLVLQVAQIYEIPVVKSCLIIRTLDVQQQNGCKDCGVFSIAFATELCSGNDPRKASFIQNDMRPHLFKCLNTGTLERFPQYSPQAVKTICIHRCEPENITRELYCICRMPDHYDKRMVQCTLCQAWYHYRCMEIRNKKDISVNWRCSTCSKCLA